MEYHIVYPTYLLGGWVLCIKFGLEKEWAHTNENINNSDLDGMSLVSFLPK